MPLPVVCDEHDRLMLYLPLLSVWRCGEPGCGREFTDEDYHRLSVPGNPGALVIRVTKGAHT